MSKENIPQLLFKKHHENASIPHRATAGSAGFDIRYCSDNKQPLVIKSGMPVIVPTGLCAEIPEGYELQVRSRSGLAAKGINVYNSPGTIDSDYRHEIKIILHSIRDDEFTIEHNDRIAQLVFAKVEPVQIVEVYEVSAETSRVGGFGSTGIE